MTPVTSSTMTSVLLHHHWCGTWKVVNFKQVMLAYFNNPLYVCIPSFCPLYKIIIPSFVLYVVPSLPDSVYT